MELKILFRELGGGGRGWVWDAWGVLLSGCFFSLEASLPRAKVGRNTVTSGGPVTVLENHPLVPFPK